MILKEEYTDHYSALLRLNLESLTERRQTLAKKFAIRCTRNENFKNLFPLNQRKNVNLRKQEKYEVKFSRTLRLCKSSIPTMQRLLNE